jgi:hypothetical protein
MLLCIRAILTVARAEFSSFLYTVLQEQTNVSRMMNDDDDCSEGMSLSSSSAQGEDALAIADKETAIDSTKERPKKKPIRGKGYTTMENLMASKAWIAASCDEINGSKQKGSNFEDAGGESIRKSKQSRRHVMQINVPAMLVLEWWPMVGQMMGMDKDDVDHYSSLEEKRKYASSLLRLQSAQLERQEIELEEENNRRRKICKDNDGEPVESAKEHTGQFISFDVESEE